MNVTKKKLLLMAPIVIIVAGLVIVAMLFLPYRNAHSKLDTEFSRLKVINNSPIGETYSSGICRSNCPTLDKVYSLHIMAPKNEIREATQILKAKGYTVDPIEANDTTLSAQRQTTEGTFVLYLDVSSSDDSDNNIAELPGGVQQPYDVELTIHYEH
ncbi:MAG: hypothetical protein WA843_05115 [Candidatus Saccharimonadales bacterium]